jgi:hypothetical protein
MATRLQAAKKLNLEDNQMCKISKKEGHFRNEYTPNWRCEVGS